MEPDKNAYNSIDEYISQFPVEIQEKLQTLRKVIKEAAPEAEEKISYRMPAFDQNGTLVYFAAFKDHISFFPTASGVEVFKDDLKGFKTSKGTIQLPLDEPMPFALIRKIVKFKVAENTDKAKGKSKKK